MIDKYGVMCTNWVDPENQGIQFYTIACKETPFVLDIWKVFKYVFSFFLLPCAPEIVTFINKDIELRIFFIFFGFVRTTLVD